ncbi:hypothetical protein [Paenibacillus sp. NPDC057934]|uniref:hypothetical protein n=1 Tax=Paenibacillus sp. NPDC057934 TaxID=3346282 RepID=UPI0036DD5CA5
MEIAAELNELKMTCEEVAASLAKPYRLSKKGHRLLAYLLDDSKSENIGHICKALNTMPRTLIGKTKPGLVRKIDTVGAEAWERDMEAALQSSSDV